MSADERVNEDASRTPKGKRAPRAPMLDVVVTQEHIDRGVPKDSGFCIFAEAIKDVFPEATKVAADLQTIRFSHPKKGLRYTYLTPRRCQVVIVLFDQEVRPAPFTFRLRGGQVTRMARRQPLTDEERAQRKAASERSRETARLRGSSGTGNVPDKIGGRPPPVQKVGDNVPFSRKRAFGLRALVR